MLGLKFIHTDKREGVTIVVTVNPSSACTNISICVVSTIYRWKGKLFFYAPVLAGSFIIIHMLQVSHHTSEYIELSHCDLWCILDHCQLVEDSR